MKKLIIIISIVLVVIIGILLLTNKNEQTVSENVVRDGNKITINHEKGSIELDETPKNIVSLSTTYTESLVALGVIPVGATTKNIGSDEFPEYVSEELNAAGTTSLGWQTAPNIEKISGLEPDLILITPSIEELYPKLEQIAPTVVWEFNGKGSKTWDWRVLLRDLALIFEKSDEAEEIINNYDSEVEEVNQQIAQKMPDETVMYLRIMENEIRYYGIGKQGFLYDEFNFARPDDLPDAQRSFEVISIEKLLQVDPDHIILLTDKEEYLDKLVKSNSLYKDLTAYKKDQIYEVDYSVWQLGFGPITAQIKLDELVEIFDLK